MELQSFSLDGLPNVRFESIEDVLVRAAATETGWRLFFERLVEAAVHLRSCKPAVRLNAFLLPDRPPKLHILGPNQPSIKSSIILWADYFDRTPVEAYAGLHFRLQIKRDGSKLSRDVRTAELGEVARQIRLAFSLRDA